MKSVVFNGPYDVGVEVVPDPKIEKPTDAIVQVVAAAVCGSDLWTYRGQAAVRPGARIGHEFVGRVVAVGDQVDSVALGDWVITPFRYSDGECRFCRDGLPTSCTNGGFWGREVTEAGQAELVRVPQANGTLVKVTGADEAPDPRLVPSLLTLTDVMSTGHHAVLNAQVKPGSTVAIVGDGAVGQCAIIAARLAGAQRIIMLGGRHRDRQELALRLGADDFITVREAEAVAAVTELTAGELADAVIECVGTATSFTTALALARAGSTLGYVGLPHGISVELATLFPRNIGISGGVAPARSYIPDLIPLVLDAVIDPGQVFTSKLSLDEAATAYQLMDERRTVKAMLTP